MKSIDIETLRPYVNGIAHALKLAQHHAREKNIDQVEIEIHKALMELEALREKSNKPYAERGERAAKGPAKRPANYLLNSPP